MGANLLIHNELCINSPTLFEYVKFIHNSFCIKILTPISLLVLQKPHIHKRIQELVFRERARARIWVTQDVYILFFIVPI